MFPLRPLHPRLPDKRLQTEDRRLRRSLAASSVDHRVRRYPSAARCVKPQDKSRVAGVSDARFVMPPTSQHRRETDRRLQTLSPIKNSEHPGKPHKRQRHEPHNYKRNSRSL